TAALDADVFHRPDVHVDVRESRRRQVLELFQEDAFRLIRFFDVDVVPLAVAQTRQILDQTGVPLGPDAHHREIHTLLRHLLRQFAATRFAGGLTVSEDEHLAQRTVAGVLLQFLEGNAHSFIHRRAARINIVHIDAVHYLVYSRPLRERRGRQ